MILHIVFYEVVSFLFTRAHGVPFVPLSTPRAHILTAPLQGAIAMGAMLPPIPPSIRQASQQLPSKKIVASCLAVSVFLCIFAPSK